MTLEELRKKIDIVDDELLELLRKRLGFVQKVGELKVSQGEENCMIRPAREASMMRQLIDKSEEIFSSGIIYSLWRAIIAGSTMREAPFAVSLFMPGEDKSAYWLAREYFGGDTTYFFHTGVLPVIHEVAAGKVAVGVLPLVMQGNPRPWWVEMLSLRGAIRVFAMLPFVENLPFAVEPIVAVAKVPTEATGNDITLAVVLDYKSISRETIHQQFGKQGVAAREWLRYEEGIGNKTERYQLFALEGFYEGDSAEITAVTQALNAVNTAEKPVEIHLIGHYAVPMKKV